VGWIIINGSKLVNGATLDALASHWLWVLINGARRPLLISEAHKVDFGTNMIKKKQALKWPTGA